MGSGILTEHGALVGLEYPHLQTVPRQVEHPVEPLGAAVDEQPQQILLYAAAAHLQPVGRQLLLVDMQPFLSHDAAVDRGDLAGQRHQPLVLVQHDDVQSALPAAGRRRQAADAAADDDHFRRNALRNILLANRVRRRLPAVPFLWGTIGVELHLQPFGDLPDVLHGNGVPVLLLFLFAHEHLSSLCPARAGLLFRHDHHDYIMDMEKNKRDLSPPAGSSFRFTLLFKYDILNFCKSSTACSE